MYEDYYGFTENPFSLTPDPKYHFGSVAHANALDLVRYAMARGEGPIALAGEAGTGKTTLCRAIADRLNRSVISALVAGPIASEEELLRAMLLEFGIISRGEAGHDRIEAVSKARLAAALDGFLSSLQRLPAYALLLVDNANAVPPRALAQVRVWSAEQKLQLLFVGTEHRTSLRYELKPLSRDETAEYLAHRLEVADGSHVSFSPGAAARIHRCTRGVPRLVNVLCDRALLAASADGTNRVLSSHVDVAAECLDLARPGRLQLAFAR
jgi:general secretion pathway protein A